MKKLIAFFIASIIGLTAFATNFYTVQDGDFNNASIWRGGHRPGYNSVNKWSGTKDTVFIMHNVAVNSSF